MRKAMQATLRLGMASLLAFGLALAVVQPVAAAEGSQARLGELVRERLRAGGPFFTPAERAVIERKCGYAPGEWDGIEFQNIDGDFRCANGRELDDPEVRAIMVRAQPRIQRRVRAVMDSPEVEAAIDGVVQEATDRALRDLEARRRIR